MSRASAKLNQRLQQANQRCRAEADASPKLEEVLNMLDLHLQSSDLYSEVAENLLEYFTDGRFPEELISPCQELLAQYMPSGREIIKSTSDAIKNVVNPHHTDRDHLDALRNDLITTITAYFG